MALMDTFSPSPFLQTDLLTVKHTSDPAVLFPSHAYGRGGVGHFLCTGHSRAGLHRLPQAASQATNLSLTARGRLASSRSGGASVDGGGGGEAGSSISGFSLAGSDPLAVGATRAWEAGSVQHASNFVSSCRTVRPTDVPRGSKWAAVSFFENSPREVARHMQVMDFIQAKQDMGKAAERQTEQARHNIWAEQQRGTFRRQRLEQAARYTQAGMRPRSAYAELGALAAAEATHDGGGASVSYSQDGSLHGIAPPPDASARFYGSAPLRESLGRSGTLGASTVAAAAARGTNPYGSRTAQLPYSPGGKPRPSTALAAGAVYTGRGGPLTATGAAAAAGGNPFSATLAAAASVAGGAAVGVAVPLPKKTYTHVFDRMAAEAAETPAARAAAVAAAQTAAEEEKRQAVLDGELQELESFEARMRSLQRARSRAAHSERRRGSGHYEDDDA